MTDPLTLLRARWPDDDPIRLAEAYRIRYGDDPPCVRLIGLADCAPYGRMAIHADVPEWRLLDDTVIVSVARAYLKAAKASLLARFQAMILEA